MFFVGIWLFLLVVSFFSLLLERFGWMGLLYKVCILFDDNGFGIKVVLFGEWVILFVFCLFFSIWNIGWGIGVGIRLFGYCGLCCKSNVFFWMGIV